MKQRLDSHPVLITPDYNETLILAIELSNSKGVLAAQVPGLANVKNKRTIEPTVEALMAAIDGYRARAAKTGRKVQRIIATYEAGWSGVWLARWRGFVVRPGAYAPSQRVVPPSWSSPVPDAGPWWERNPAGCEVSREPALMGAPPWITPARASCAENKGNGNEVA